jgi:hypothetical protein
VKIFGIGLPKTCTSSVSRAMKILGYTVSHDKRASTPGHTINQANKVDFISGAFCSAIYAKLLKTYPNGKFIYTERPLEEWLKSCEYWWDNRRGCPHWRRAIFGITNFDKAVFTEKYYSHKNACKALVPAQQILIASVTETEDELLWRQLCSFTGKNIPGVPFPWLNSQSRKELRT